MRTEGKVSKVAYCPVCGDFIEAGHVDGMGLKDKRRFSDYADEGYIVKTETIEETKKRDYAICNCIK